ncbi:MAG TPA: NPCBM/NEW2 domain-containing protein, partial [Verrucomicrobiae bacterium]
MRRAVLCPFLLLTLTTIGFAHSGLAQPPHQGGVEYLSEHPELILEAAQDWGELGLNAAAHRAGIAGEPLVIAGQSFAKGLGHHANGSLTVLLNGEFETFDASVGLQPCAAGGSVVFRAWLDGRAVFDSGCMAATNAAKALHLDTRGAGELRLEANDAGDGITCDMANWAEARLVRVSGAARKLPAAPVDIAPFGRIVTWDANRLDGARANRIEEFLAEDVYLETTLAPERDGAYRLLPGSNGLACIGIQWLNRRALAQLELLFETQSETPASDKIQVQGWFGESAWQGTWKPLAGDIELKGSRIEFRLGPGAGTNQTRKIRWVFPATKETRVRGLSAYTRSRWETVQVMFEMEAGRKPDQSEIRIINGEPVSASSG